ncbi:MAG: hypothetical protein GY739_17875 [Mesoflavibacter sp.]|nr:hypothetical protein [Mesoflavibacter sp.]
MSIFILSLVPHQVVAPHQAVAPLQAAVPHQGITFYDIDGTTNILSYLTCIFFK